jgi:hypothetical protein
VCVCVCAHSTRVLRCTACSVTGIDPIREALVAQIKDLIEHVFVVLVLLLDLPRGGRRGCLVPNHAPTMCMFVTLIIYFTNTIMKYI